MLALLELTQGKGEAVLILCIALFVIVVGLVGYRWVSRSESRHIERREEPG